MSRPCCRFRRLAAALPVDVLFDGRGKMYLHTGWEKLARSHDLQAICMLTFCYQGGEEISVKVFDDNVLPSDDKEDDD
jgi:hypothetical protein